MRLRATADDRAANGPRMLQELTDDRVGIGPLAPDVQNPARPSGSRHVRIPTDRFRATTDEAGHELAEDAAHLPEQGLEVRCVVIHAQLHRPRERRHHGGNRGSRSRPHR